MKDESKTGYAIPSFPPGGPKFKRITGTERLKSNTGTLRPSVPLAPLRKDTLSVEERMKEINETASFSASHCKIIGHLSVFSSRVRRGIALKQRFRPDDDAHPLFLTI